MQYPLTRSKSIYQRDTIMGFLVNSILRTLRPMKTYYYMGTPEEKKMVLILIISMFLLKLAKATVSLTLMA